MPLKKSTQVFLTKFDKLKTKKKDDLLTILILRLFKANIINLDKYVFATKLTIKEFKT